VAWRSRQARLSQALDGIEDRPLGETFGRAAGELWAASRRPDFIDASIVPIAHDGDEVVTTDLADLRPLALACGRHIELIHP
jgi:hypothetical protein